jgi:TM2 domain-containing membrane protein YozV
MYCRYCSQPITGAEAVCPRCGQPVSNVGAPPAQGFGTPPGQPSAGFRQNVVGAPGMPYSPTAAGGAPKQRVAYILLGLFLGTLGVHNFYAGYTGKAVAQLLVTLLTGWLGVPILAIWIWNIVEIITVERDATGVPFT